MLGRTYEGQDCSAARTLELVGERWSLLILRDALFRGYTRFGQFQNSLEISTNVLASRLTAFVDHGLLAVEEGTERRAYRVTEKGRALVPVLMALTEWGDAWVAPGPIEFVDGSGQPVSLSVVQPGGQPVPPGSVSVRRRTQARV